MYQKEVDKIPKEVFSGNKTKAIKLYEYGSIFNKKDAVR